MSAVPVSQPVAIRIELGAIFISLEGAVMSGRRFAIKGDIWLGDGHGCGHVSGLGAWV